MTNIIAVDHGYKNIKTVHCIFTTGLEESTFEPAMGEDVIRYEGKYYVLSENRMGVQEDKTVNNRYFILTLFAIAKEIEAAHLYDAGRTYNIELAVGLPTGYHGQQKKGFIEYLTKVRRGIQFTHRGKTFSINITKVQSFPQAFAAVMTRYSELKDLPKVSVIDIGGLTVNYLMLKNGKPVPRPSGSLQEGMIRLYSTVDEVVNSETILSLAETEIDAILDGANSDCKPRIQELVKHTAKNHANKIFSLLRERGIELQTGTTVFVGGGAKTLRRQIEATRKAERMMFVEDIHANAKGFELLYKASLIAR